MHGTRQLGGRAKYLVIALWLAVVVVAGPRAAKLSGAENNDARAFLPVHAESTRVLDLQESFQSPNLLPAVVVYDRPSGLTAADRAKVARDAKRFATAGHTDGPVSGPAFSSDGQAAEVVVPFDLGSNGWEHASAVVDRVTAIAGVRRDSPSRSRARPGTRRRRAACSTASTRRSSTAACSSSS